MLKSVDLKKVLKGVLLINIEKNIITTRQANNIVSNIENYLNNKNENKKSESNKIIKTVYANQEIYKHV